MKFKVGDKVKILPSAVNGGVSEKAVGKIGELTVYCCGGGYFEVMMCDRKNSGPNPHLSWAVFPHQMEPAIKVGQQLLFNFMQQS